MQFNWKKLLALAVGYAVAGYGTWYFLGIGLSTNVLVATNGMIAALLLLAFSFLDAYGLGEPKHWLWAIPANALVPVMGLHFGYALLIPLLWILILLPTAAVGRPRFLVGPKYLVTCIVLLAVAAFLPYALINWVPKVTGLNMQLASFALRFGFAYAIFIAAWGTLLDYIGREARSNASAANATAAQPVGA
jgi:hypothetical protein